MEDHSHHLVEVGVEYHPVKDAGQYIQVHLEAGRYQGSQDPVICIKEFCKALNGPSETIWAVLVLCN